jgi:hypothetical protein
MMAGCMGLDVHRDTPVEILHTILLGSVKYLWGQVCHRIDSLAKKKQEKFDLLRARLASISESGLNLPKLKPDYIVDYKGGLIGKHFKSLVQLMPFVVYDLLDAEMLHYWIILGRLATLLWQVEIKDMKQFTVSFHDECSCPSNKDIG